jgi:hypothetical protein
MSEHCHLALRILKASWAFNITYRGADTQDNLMTTLRRCCDTALLREF